MAIEAMQYWTSLQFRDELTSIIQTNLISSEAFLIEKLQIRKLTRNKEIKHLFSSEYY